MPRFHVTVARRLVQRLVIEVEAINDLEAMEKAEEVAPNHDFNDGTSSDCEYEALDVSRDVPTEPRVFCCACGNDVPGRTAHRHQGEWIGECCWDERLRPTE